MGELIQILIQKKLIKKDVDPTHRRIQRLSLTAKGKKLMQESNLALDRMEAELFKEFNEADKDLFRTLIGKILSTGPKQTDAHKEDLRNQS
jgi:DNA-binding MarR family transcriptional regulator